jgi:serine/threonine protein kinase
MLRVVVPFGDGTVGIAQLAERRVVVPVVAGSNPVTHPNPTRRESVASSTSFWADRLLALGASCEVWSGRVEGRASVRKRTRFDDARAALEREATCLERLERSGFDACPRLLAFDPSAPELIETHVQGEPLSRLFEVLGAPLPGRLGVHLAWRVVARFAELHAIAEDGEPIEFVHGDPSPAQLIVTPGNDVALVDFGASGLRTRDGVVRSATGRGTVPWAAPELVRDATTPTQATDRYAAAAIAAFALVGDALLPSVTGGARVVHIGTRGLNAHATSGLPAPVADPLHAHLALDPSERPTNLHALRDALDILRGA